MDRALFEMIVVVSHGSALVVCVDTVGASGQAGKPNVRNTVSLYAFGCCRLLERCHSGDIF